MMLALSMDVILNLAASPMLLIVTMVMLAL